MFACYSCMEEEEFRIILNVNYAKPTTKQIVLFLAAFVRWKTPEMTSNGQFIMITKTLFNWLYSALTFVLLRNFKS